MKIGVKEKIPFPQTEKYVIRTVEQCNRQHTILFRRNCIFGCEAKLTIDMVLHHGKHLSARCQERSVPFHADTAFIYRLKMTCNIHAARIRFFYKHMEHDIFAFTAGYTGGGVPFGITCGYFACCQKFYKLICSTKEKYPENLSIANRQIVYLPQK